MELNPVLILVLLLAGGLYQRAIVRLRRRGYAVPAAQRCFWWIGMFLLTAGLLGPLAVLSDELFSAHMGEHLMIADFAAPFLLAGIRTPVFLFMPPRDLLIAISRNRPLRRLGSFVTRPLVALPLYVLILYSWHLGPMFTAATTNPAFHALQHQSFLIGNLLLWWPAIEPARRPMPAELWKIGYLLAGRMASILMGAVFLVSNRAFYSNLYGRTAESHGMSPLLDQQVGASLMMMADVVIMFAVLAVFFARAAKEGQARDEAEDRLRQSEAERPPA